MVIAQVEWLIAHVAAACCSQKNSNKIQPFNYDSKDGLTSFHDARRMPRYTQWVFCSSSSANLCKYCSSYVHHPRKVSCIGYNIKLFIRIFSRKLRSVWAIILCAFFRYSKKVCVESRRTWWCSCIFVKLFIFVLFFCFFTRKIDSQRNKQCKEEWKPPKYGI